MRLRLRDIALVLILALAAGSNAPACPACFAGTDSPAQAGMNWAIFAMLGITGTVLGLIVTGALFFIRRARAAGRQEPVSGRAYVDEEGQLLLTTNVEGFPKWNIS